MTALADDVSTYLKRRARWSPFEIAFWIVALPASGCSPTNT